MKKIYIVAGLLIVAAVGFMSYTTLLKPQLDDQMVNVVVPAIVGTDSFSFTYPSGEQAYTLIEPPVPESVVDGLEKIYIIMDTARYQFFQSTSTDGVTPPAVSIFVLQEPEKTAATAELNRLERLKVWATQNPQYTSFSHKTAEPETIEVDGIELLRYQTTGTLNQEVHLASYRGRIYVFSGQFASESDALLEMYRGLITTLVFN